MGTIHDKKRRNSELDELLKGTPNADKTTSPTKVDEPVAVATVVKEDDHAALLKQNQLEMQSYSSQALQALSMVDDMVTKDYVMRLSEMEIVPVDTSEIGRDTIVFKVNKMVYEKDEYATENSSMHWVQCAMQIARFLLLDGHKNRTDFYIGIRNNDEEGPIVQ